MNARPCWTCTLMSLIPKSHAALLSASCWRTATFGPRSRRFPRPAPVLSLAGSKGTNLAPCRPSPDIPRPSPLFRLALGGCGCLLDHQILAARLRLLAQSLYLCPCRPAAVVVLPGGRQRRNHPSLVTSGRSGVATGPAGPVSAAPDPGGEIAGLAAVAGEPASRCGPCLPGRGGHRPEPQDR